jgi:hypothetical protein
MKTKQTNRLGSAAEMRVASGAARGFWRPVASNHNSGTKRKLRTKFQKSHLFVELDFVWFSN